MQAGLAKAPAADATIRALFCPRGAFATPLAHRHSPAKAARNLCMSLCTRCHQGHLGPTPLGTGLTAYACNACAGLAIDLTAYLNWRMQQPRLPATPEVPTLPAHSRIKRPNSHGYAVSCPGCKRPMVKHFAHAGPSPEVHTCLRCEVICLDPGVWAYFEAIGLHTSLTAMTTLAWQNRRSHLNVHLQLNEDDRKQLGDDVYQQALQIDAWLKTQPNRAQIMKMLNRLGQ